MKTNFHEMLAKCGLIFLIGIALYFILDKIAILDGSFWKAILVGALSVVLAEVFFNYGNQKGNKK